MSASPVYVIRLPVSIINRAINPHIAPLIINQLRPILLPPPDLDLTTLIDGPDLDQAESSPKVPNTHGAPS